MGRRIRVESIRKEEPNTRLYVLALIALARQLQEEDVRQEDEATRPAAPKSEEADRG
jgi:hypothetical protein